MNSTAQTEAELVIWYKSEVRLCKIDLIKLPSLRCDRSTYWKQIGLVHIFLPWDAHLSVQKKLKKGFTNKSEIFTAALSWERIEKCIVCCLKSRPSDLWKYALQSAQRILQRALIKPSGGLQRNREVVWWVYQHHICFLQGRNSGSLKSFKTW